MQVHRTIHTLPPFWERKAVFIANLLSLFFGNDAETDELRRKVGTLETYGGRLLPILDLLFRGRPNLLVLDRAPDPDMVALFRDRLGLSLPEVVTLNHNDYRSFASDHPTDTALDVGRHLRNHPAKWIDGFVTDNPLVHLASHCDKSTISTLEGSRLGNNKVLLHEHLTALGLPTFDSVLLERAEDAATGANSLADKGYRRGVVKSQIGASGIGLLIIDDLHNPPSIPDYMLFEGPCLLQGWLDDGVPGVERIGSPSVQLYLNDTDVYLYDMTEQILGEQSVHEGNVAPPPWATSEPGLCDDLLSQADSAATWLHNQEYRGTASVDFHVVRRNGAFEVRVCEINARVTGATYPAVLARHLVPGCTWLMRNLRFSDPLAGGTLLAALHKAGLLIEPGQSSGVCPINVNLNQHNQVVKGQFLCVAETLDATQQLLQDIQHHVPTQADYDRD